MKILQDALEEFGTINLPWENIAKIGNNYYLLHDALKNATQSIDEICLAKGALLAQKKGKQLFFTPELLELLATQTTKKIILNKKASWLFICGRDVFEENILHAFSPAKKTVIVCNQQEEVLGLARKQQQKGTVLYKNLFDIGSFLRRSNA